MTNTVEEERGISPLEILDELDEFRRKHQNDRLHPSDWCMRVMEAIVAEAYGYKGRNSWTEALKADPNSRYHRDLQDTTKQGF